MSVYITGDTHGRFERVKRFCECMGLPGGDVVVILGDAGLNYYLDARDRWGKSDLAGLAPAFLHIHGNHEEMPSNVSGYHLEKAFGSDVWVEGEFPNIIFACDGEIRRFGSLRGSHEGYHATFPLSSSWDGRLFVSNLV